MSTKEKQGINGRQFAKIAMLAALAVGSASASINGAGNCQTGVELQNKPAAHNEAERLRHAAQQLLQARRQLAHAKANVKAAEAEYKWAKAGKEAADLRQVAQGMASNYGIAGGKDNLQPAQAVAAASTTAVAAKSESAPSAPSAQSAAPVPGEKGDLKPEKSKLDFNAKPIDDLDVPDHSW